MHRYRFNYRRCEAIFTKVEDMDFDPDLESTLSAANLSANDFSRNEVRPPVEDIILNYIKEKKVFQPFDIVLRKHGLRISHVVTGMTALNDNDRVWCSGPIFIAIQRNP